MHLKNLFQTRVLQPQEHPSLCDAAGAVASHPGEVDGGGHAAAHTATALSRAGEQNVTDSGAWKNFMFTPALPEINLWTQYYRLSFVQELARVWITMMMITKPFM